MSQSGEDDSLDRLIGLVLFLLPLVLMYALVQFWPGGFDQRTQSLVSYYATKSDLNQSIATKQTILNRALNAEAEANKTSDVAAKNAAKMKREQAEKALSDDNAKLDDTISEIASIQTTLDKDGEAPGLTFRFFGVLTPDAQFMILVILSGALGSSSFAAWAFAMHKAHQSYDTNWRWWYFLRIPMGMLLALIFYFVLRGGLFGATFDQIGKPSGQAANPYGFAALSALTGMFTGRAATKLEEIFSLLFSKTEKKFGPAPEVVGPATHTVDNTGANVDVNVTGKNFVQGVTASINGLSREGEFKSATEFKLKLKPEDVKIAQELKLRLENPDGARGSVFVLKIA